MSLPQLQPVCCLSMLILPCFSPPLFALLCVFWSVCQLPAARSLPPSKFPSNRPDSFCSVESPFLQSPYVHPPFRRVPFFLVPSVPSLWPTGRVTPFRSWLSFFLATKHFPLLLSSAAPVACSMLFRFRNGLPADPTPPPPDGSQQSSQAFLFQVGVHAFVVPIPLDFPKLVGNGPKLTTTIFGNPSFFSLFLPLHKPPSAPRDAELDCRLPLVFLWCVEGVLKPHPLLALLCLSPVVGSISSLRVENPVPFVLSP